MCDTTRCSAYICCPYGLSFNRLEGSMKRRTFLKQGLLYAPAAWALFSACGDDSPGTVPVDERRHFIVVGAGIAGLHAASMLLRQGHEVEILEAGVRWGGRIRTIEDFGDTPVEAGAEEVHGHRSVWYDIVSRAGGTLVDIDTNDFVQIDKQLLSWQLAAQQIDMQKAIQFIDRVLVYNFPTDKTVGQFATEAQLPQRVWHYVNASLGNEHGTSIDRIGIKGLAEQEKRWTAGEKSYTVTNRSFKQVLQQTYGEAIAKVTLQAPVISIDYSGAQVKVTDANKKVRTADKVLVTVPLTAMKAGDIQFTPALPAEVTDAYARLGMDAGIKVILKFKSAFWPPNTGSIFTSGAVPEYWITANGRNNTSMLTAFVMGEPAEKLSAKGSAAIQLLVDELAALYNEAPVKDQFEEGRVIDWRRDPYIRGAYSYPLVNGGLNARRTIAQPLNNKVFFAGEATHIAGHSGTVHGALETAIRAVEEMSA